MQLLTNLDLTKNELQNARLQNLAVAPGNPVPGQVFFHSGDQIFYGWNGSAWIDLGQALSGVDIVSLINASSSRLDDDNLSAAANDATAKRHAHANAPILEATTAAYTAAEKTKLVGIVANANNYAHPTGDGNLHVPATGTTNGGKVLKAGATAGSLAWGTLSAAEVGALSANGTATAASKLAAARTLSVTGDATGSASFDGSADASINATLANSGVTAGTYPKVTVDAKGRVTAGTPLAAADIPDLTLSKISDAGSAASKNTGISSGNVPILGSDGKLDTAVLPALAISDTFVVASQAAMLAVAAQVGDVAVRTDLNKSLILKTEPASTLANWQELLTPTDAVTSVAGKTGAVTLTKTDVGLGNVDNIQQATKAEFNTHAADAVRHILGAERTGWNAKTGKFVAAIGNGTATQFIVTHNLGSMDVTVTIRESATPYEVIYTDVQIIDANSVRVLFGQPPTAGQYRVIAIG